MIHLKGLPIHRLLTCLGFDENRRTEWKKLPVQRQNMVVELVQAAATVGIVTVGIWMTSLLS